MSKEVLARLESACETARVAGDLTLRFFLQDSLTVDRKADDSPVTEADRQAETLMRDRIANAFPHDAIVGEEYGATPGSSGFQWILDPIDGTKSFISGVPLYSVLIGVLRDEVPVIGVIRIPALKEVVYAAMRHGAWWIKGNASPRPARVSSTPALREGLFLTSEVKSFSERGAAEAYTRLEQLSRITRTWGDGYGYLLLATGRAEAMVDPIMNLWDAAALLPVLQEAGGSFTDWQGRARIESGEGVGTNSRVREEVLAITRAYPKRS